MRLTTPMDVACDGEGGGGGREGVGIYRSMLSASAKAAIFRSAPFLAIKTSMADIRCWVRTSDLRHVKPLPYKPLRTARVLQRQSRRRRRPARLLPWREVQRLWGCRGRCLLPWRGQLWLMERLAEARATATRVYERPRRHTINLAVGGLSRRRISLKSGSK